VPVQVSSSQVSVLLTLQISIELMFFSVQDITISGVILCSRFTQLQASDKSIPVIAQNTQFMLAQVYSIFHQTVFQFCVTQLAQGVQWI